MGGAAGGGDGGSGAGGGGEGLQALPESVPLATTARTPPAAAASSTPTGSTAASAGAGAGERGASLPEIGWSRCAVWHQSDVLIYPEGEPVA